MILTSVKNYFKDDLFRAIVIMVVPAAVLTAVFIGLYLIGSMVQLHGDFTK